VGVPPRGGRLSRAAAAAVALAADLAWGEPPARLHPTVWMGRWIAAGRANRVARGRAGSFAEGLAWTAAGAAAAWGIARVAERAVPHLPRLLSVAAEGLALKPALSLRALLAAASEVETALAAGDLPEARRLLSWHLVSRDTSGLSGAEVAGAAIESIAENLGDGVVGPLLYHRAGGLSAAYLHRFLNTADAMLGYRTPELEWYGKAAARADDAANLAPSRISALCIALAAPAGGGDTGRALRVAMRDAGRTDSPNAGWPMAAMAGALGVRLDKRGVYALNDDGRAPTADDLRRARRIVGAAAGIVALLVSLVPARRRRGW
jgi:adenosylcobinamide-phosphate synthase